jgi:hypothetical protein
VTPTLTVGRERSEKMGEDEERRERRRGRRRGKTGNSAAPMWRRNVVTFGGFRRIACVRMTTSVFGEMRWIE